MLMKNRYDIGAEEICGYKVSSNRKKLWVYELDIIEYLETICNQLNIQYFTCFGSAIGAVRHKGFIPWDDDIDVGMLREDFEIFIEKAPHLFPSHIDIQYGISEHGCDPLLRIRDARTTGIVSSEISKKGNKGCFVEIYPFDYVDDNYIRKIQLLLTKQILLELNLRTTNISNQGAVGYSRRAKVRAVLLKPFGADKLWKVYEKICKFQNKRKNVRKYVDTIGLPVYAQTGHHLFEKKDVVSTFLSEFEYTKIRIPKGYDHVLRTRYGDYMQLPPVNQRGTHHENIVFYDPNKSYSEYENSDIPSKYFAGDNSLELL